MMAIASKIRFRDQGLALTVTAGLHIAVIAWLGTVEMHETLKEPQPKTIQLQFIQLSPPVQEQPKVKQPEAVVEKKVADQLTQKKQVEQPKEIQQKTDKKFVESQSEKVATVSNKQPQQVSTEKPSTTTETKKVAEIEPKSNLATQSMNDKPTTSKAQSSETATFDVKNYQPVSKIAPAYPESALDRKIEGDCTVVYSVNEKGRVENPKAQGDCHPMFVRPSIQAALNFKYQPRLVDGKPTSVLNVKNTFQYRIS
ncbi:energy transducer TonB [Acinetobacter sp. VNK23]|uniref:energy transducer TonB n=1 Tax=Acinetobacter thutiue TaxID=2998078 RepID=UPI00257598C3|nr:energy transducer TonB [Acinetobacter thutiue]MDM1022186.1 energy transducer TonB [Acinetobacter thutiue]